MSKQYDSLSTRKVQLKVGSGATWPHCPYTVMLHGDKFTVEHVQGHAQGDEEVNFDTSDEGSSVHAPRVIGGTAYGSVHGDNITLDRLGKSGKAHSSGNIDINSVMGYATAGKSANVGVIHENAHVDTISDLMATQGIYGWADASSITTPFIGKMARVNARHGLVRSDQIDGKAKGHNVEAGIISRGAEAKALYQVTVGQLRGYAEAERVVITGEIIGTRFIDKKVMDLIFNLDPMAKMHDSFKDDHGIAIANVFHLKGARGDIDLGRLLTIYRKRQVWNDEMKRPHEENAIKKLDLFVQMKKEDGKKVYPGSFFDTVFEVRDLATGKVKSHFTIKGETVEGAKLRLMAVLSEKIEC